MAFKLKDLVVDVHPVGPFPITTPCQTLTFCSALVGPPWLPALSLACTQTLCVAPTFCSASPFGNPAHDLQQLKASLREALAQVEARERELAAGEKPRTLAEAEDLEAKLEGALAELREHKKTLR